MTRTKALRGFFEKFFGYKSLGMTVSEILNDVTENAEFDGGGEKKEYIFDSIDFETEEMIWPDSDYVTNVYPLCTESQFEALLDGLPFAIEYDGSTYNISSSDDIRQYLISPSDDPESYLLNCEFGFTPETGSSEGSRTIFLCCRTSGKHTFGIYKTLSQSASGNCFYNINDEGSRPVFDGYVFEEVYAKLNEGDPVLFHFNGTPALYAYTETENGIRKICVGKVSGSSGDGRVITGVNIIEYRFLEDGNFGVRLGSISFSK